MLRKLAALILAAFTRLPILSPPHGGGQEGLQDLLVDLRRLDALGLCADSGIMKKWADKYGIEVEIVQINDYIESINQYTAGDFDGCSMTNMDALTIPAAAASTPRR